MPRNPDFDDDVLTPPEANYRRLSTSQLKAIRAELIATHNRRHGPLDPDIRAMMIEMAPEVPIPNFDPAPEAEPFFVARVACIDRILAERAVMG